MALVWAGLCIVCAGALSIIRPPRFLAIRSRRVGASLAAGGLIAAAVGGMLPSALVRSKSSRTHLDDFVPAYHFHECHSIRIHASAQAVFSAVKAVTADEIQFFRLLTWVRSPRLKRPGGESILAPRSGTPILEVAMHSGFLLLADQPPVELVFGTILGRRALPREPRPEDFLTSAQPGSCKVAMNFLLEPDGQAAVRLSTETRVFAVDSPARRRFAIYWRVIYPGSAFIRRMWLEAIKRRAESNRPPLPARQTRIPSTDPV